MFLTTLIAAFLVAVTVVVHASGFSLLIRSTTKSRAAAPIQSWPTIWLIIQLAWWLILIHAVEISIWAVFYLAQNCLPDAESAFYFSGVTYTAIGYGDLVLPKPWRLFGAVEALTGILMCGLSTALFFALLTRIYASRWEQKPKWAKYEGPGI
jgi:hypothetical protein